MRFEITLERVTNGTVVRAESDTAELAAVANSIDFSSYSVRDCIEKLIRDLVDLEEDHANDQTAKAA